LTQSELILNPDGSVYHLNLLPHEIAQTIITVGDPDRVARVSQHFDKILFKKQKREFVTHTGEKNGKPITVIATGIGTDNIDIVFTELDALVNINLEKRVVKEKLTVLDFIRIGTTGAMQEDIPIDSFIASKMALGLDGLLHYYQPLSLTEKEQQILRETNELLPQPAYFARSDESLLNKYAADYVQGITATCAGFYGPQGRKLRIKPFSQNYLDHLRKMHWGTLRFTNFEMETAGIYGMANLLGHRALSLSVAAANRATQEFSKNATKAVDHLIEEVLHKI